MGQGEGQDAEEGMGDLWLRRVAAPFNERLAEYGCSSTV